MIHVVHAISSGGFYGAEKVILDLVLMQQRRADLTPTLIDFVDQGMDESDVGRRVRALQARVVRFPGGVTLGSLSRYGRLMRALRPSVVHSHGYKPTFVHSFSRFLRLHSVPLVVTSHGWDTVARGGGLRGFKDRRYPGLDIWQLSWADRVIAVSTEWAATLTERNPRLRPRVILNGIHTDVRVHGTHPLRRFLADLASGQPTDGGAEHLGPIVGAVGRLAPMKNHAALIEAVARIRTEHPCRLAIIGDGPLRAELESLWRSRMPHIEPALIPFQADILEWVQDMDVFCMPSLEGEGLPMALLEAGLLGRAVVCSDSGGMATLIDGDNGRLVRMRDQASLERALLELMSSVGLRERLGVRLRASVLAAYDVRRTEAQYWDLYQDLLRPSTRAA